jgi:predicted DNA-binding transcriptional regulator YafY
MTGGQRMDPIIRYRIEQMFSARNPSGEYVTVDAIAKRYDVSRRTVQRLMRECADRCAQYEKIRSQY